MTARAKVVKVYTSFMDGMAPSEAMIEISIYPGLPTFDVIGLCDSSIRESRGRIQPALVVSGFTMPKGHITASISPAYMKKSGTVFDLPIAIGMLMASGQLPVRSDAKIYACGEIMLDGTVHGTPAASLRLRLVPPGLTMYSYLTMRLMRPGVQGLRPCRYQASWTLRMLYMTEITGRLHLTSTILMRLTRIFLISLPLKGRRRQYALC